MNGWQRAALALALLPLLLGALVFTAWVVTDWTPLVFCGLFVLWFGLVATVVVAILLVQGHRHAARAGVAPSVRRRRTLGIALLMLANYPVAAGMMSVGQLLIARWSVTLENAADTPWAGVELQWPGGPQLVEVLAPGAQTDVSLWFLHDGVLTLGWQEAAGREHRTVIDYATSGWGGRVELVRRGPGDVRMVVRERR